MRRTDGQSDVELPQEAEADPAPPFDVDAQLVPTRHLAELDASVLEQLGHLIGAAAAVELDLGGRCVHGFDLDATGRDVDVERQLAGSLERLAPHDLRARTRRMTSRAPAGRSFFGSRASTRTSACPNGRCKNISPPNSGRSR